MRWRCSCTPLDLGNPEFPPRHTPHPHRRRRSQWCRCRPLRPNKNHSPSHRCRSRRRSSRWRCSCRPWRLGSPRFRRRRTRRRRRRRCQPWCPCRQSSPSTFHIQPGRCMTRHLWLRNCSCRPRNPGNPRFRRRRTPHHHRRRCRLPCPCRPSRPSTFRSPSRKCSSRHRRSHWRCNCRPWRPGNPLFRRRRTPHHHRRRCRLPCPCRPSRPSTFRSPSRKCSSRRRRSHWR